MCYQFAISYPAGALKNGVTRDEMLAAWPDLHGEAAQARRLKLRSKDKVRAHRTEHPTYRYWDRWIADGCPRVRPSKGGAQ